MTKQQSEYRIKTASMIFSIAVGAAGVIFALGTQNQKLNQMGVEQERLKSKVSAHDTDITEMKSDIRYIKAAVDDVKAKLDR